MKTLPKIQVEYIKTKSITQVAYSTTQARRTLPLIEVKSHFQIKEPK